MSNRQPLPETKIHSSAIVMTHELRPMRMDRDRSRPLATIVPVSFVTGKLALLTTAQQPELHFATSAELPILEGGIAPARFVSDLLEPTLSRLRIPGKSIDEVQGLLSLDEPDPMPNAILGKYEDGRDNYHLPFVVYTLGENQIPGGAWYDPADAEDAITLDASRRAIGEGPIRSVEEETIMLEVLRRLRFPHGTSPHPSA